MTAARVAALVVLGWAGSARAAADDAFLCTPDAAPPEEEWVGSSTDSQYPACVEFNWIGFGAALAPPTGMPGTQDSLVGPLVFFTSLDHNYPKMLTQMWNGTVFDVDLFVRKSGTQLLAAKVSYVDAVIGDLQADGSDDPMVTVTIRARAITYTTWTYDNVGNETSETTVTWTAPGP